MSGSLYEVRMRALDVSLPVSEWVRLYRRRRALLYFSFSVFPLYSVPHVRGGRMRNMNDDGALIGFSLVVILVMAMVVVGWLG